MELVPTQYRDEFGELREFVKVRRWDESMYNSKVYNKNVSSRYPKNHSIKFVNNEQDANYDFGNFLHKNPTLLVQKKSTVATRPPDDKQSLALLNRKTRLPADMKLRSGAGLTTAWADYLVGFYPRRSPTVRHVLDWTFAVLKRLVFSLRRVRLSRSHERAIVRVSKSSHSYGYRRYRTYRYVLFRMNAVLARQLIWLIVEGHFLKTYRKSKHIFGISKVTWVVRTSYEGKAVYKRIQVDLSESPSFTTIQKNR
ncbi:hypothetical protein ANN_17134 [Periplaneta americana]|uniref:Uncharacterized protein n=1 Tax=Periplaneta americana TaxID=6978 RepID=A0ABQ8STI1_PERAM|nr:hypothetical protein ANN_17134 [Periplaneta americana]